MRNKMEYKGYVGSVEFSEEDNVLYGKVEGIRSLLSYEGRSVQELKEDFHKVIDEYLQDCSDEGITPERPFEGKVEILISPELYRKAADSASAKRISVDSFVENAIELAVHAVG